MTDTVGLSTDVLTGTAGAALVTGATEAMGATGTIGAMGTTTSTMRATTGAGFSTR